jgi:uncharacterized protein with HEPN domain
MRRPNTPERLRHMLDAAREARAFAAGRTRGDLANDRGLALILTKLLEIVGEAANAVPADFQARHPAIPWRLIVSMRHRLIHAYFSIDTDVVWDTVSDSLPPLIAELERILADAGSMAGDGGATSEER